MMNTTVTNNSAYVGGGLSLYTSIAFIIMSQISYNDVSYSGGGKKLFLSKYVLRVLNKFCLKSFFSPRAGQHWPK